MHDRLLQSRDPKKKNIRAEASVMRSKKKKILFFSLFRFFFFIICSAHCRLIIIHSFHLTQHDSREAIFLIFYIWSLHSRPIDHQLSSDARNIDRIASRRLRRDRVWDSSLLMRVKCIYLRILLKICGKLFGLIMLFSWEKIVVFFFLKKTYRVFH